MKVWLNTKAKGLSQVGYMDAAFQQLPLIKNQWIRKDCIITRLYYMFDSFNQVSRSAHKQI